MLNNHHRQLRPEHNLFEDESIGLAPMECRLPLSHREQRIYIVQSSCNAFRMNPCIIQINFIDNTFLPHYHTTIAVRQKVKVPSFKVSVRGNAHDNVRGKMRSNLLLPHYSKLQNSAAS